jgi:hypothetical protein
MVDGVFGCRQSRSGLAVAPRKYKLPVDPDRHAQGRSASIAAAAQPALNGGVELRRAVSGQADGVGRSLSAECAGDAKQQAQPGHSWQPRVHGGRNLRAEGIRTSR